MNAAAQRIIHPFGPLFGPESRILILGSFPSVKSREQQFFYGHPQNRFWKVIAGLFDLPVPLTIPEKKELILSHGLALWDSIASCVITGSSDASIRDTAMDGNLTKCIISIFFRRSDGRLSVCPPPVRPMPSGPWRS